jgi:molecular chaperone DnaJ
VAQQRDYYEILGVSQEASASEIKTSYRNLAKKYHPDYNRESDAADRFKEIQTAYDVLSDETKRQRYDRYGHEGVQGAPGFPGGFDVGENPLSDIFDIFFGQQTGTRRSSGSTSTTVRGDDLRENLVLTLEEAATGVEKTIKFRRMDTCDTCRGSGARPGTSADTCPQCQGSGQLRFQQNTLLGVFTSSQTCTRCRGTGKMIANPCGDCSGSGRVRKMRERTVKIPAGADNEMRLRVPGEGDSGERGGPSGDLYVVLYIQEHKVFDRRGNDLICKVPISFARAALGGTIEVPVIHGVEDLRIPEGTQSGETFTLRGQGIPEIHGRGKGDLHVTLHVQVPSKLTAEQRELLKQFAASLGEQHLDNDSKGLLGKLFGH